MLIESIFVAIIPVLFYIAIIYVVDRYEKEPLWLLAAAFLWGAIPSIIFAFIVNTVLSIPFYVFAGESLGDALSASLIAPLVEESIKGLLLLVLLIIWRHEIDSILDGIIYGAMIGLGFAMVENVFYFAGAFAEGGTEGWWSVVILRNVFGLNHSLFTAVTGMGIAIARLTPRPWVRFSAPVMGWLGAMFLHFVHNASASLGNVAGAFICIPLLANSWGGVTIMLIIILWAIWQEKRWIKLYLADEVSAGTLSPSQYEAASSGTRRLFHRYNLLLTHGPMGYWNALRFYHKCSELAYKKHHHRVHQDSKSLQLANGLRGEIARLGERLR
ncbi:MAG: PrsW family intramembrane metalloprotease [Chloroflexi bacterium]|nr:PrsW family intramembrane metalloprotease [Chloroflexota bacterium]MBP8054936.1 PrsW family intramembrane metalloprotease [Chloroflexota bacterium]